jgi:hypothetical protein
LGERIQLAYVPFEELPGNVGRINGCVVQEDGLDERVFPRISRRLVDRFGPLPAKKALLHCGGVSGNQRQEIGAVLDILLDLQAVVVSRDGLIKNPRKWFATALEQAKIEGVTWHTLRHTFASRLVMAGVDLKTVQELMGHKTIAMTARYAPPRPDSQVAGAGDPGPSGVGFGTKWLQIGYQHQKGHRDQKIK